MTSLADGELMQALPYARRYARALTGSQSAGDAMVAGALRAGLPDMPGRLALYAGVTALAARTDQEGEAGKLSEIERQLLLLTSLEELSLDDAARVVGLPASEAGRLLEQARHNLKAAAATDVLIIEDEPVIAMDLRMLVQRCGHRVTGVAASEAEAVRLATERPTGLILADVNLGRGGDGINAVRRIMQSVRVPVIFVTAYPERLLTADRLEPAFIISKPFEPMALAIATYQAVSGGIPLD